MTRDIGPILEGWSFDPDRVTVRSITGDDGREKIQLRLDLGLMQMDVDGRPDGERVGEHESWLDLHLARQREHDAANPDGAPYQLHPEDCAVLMREGVQYYHRYVSFWSLERYELCARDTQRNLNLFRFVREHARRDRDKLQFDQWRPYVTMMHARAVATPLLELRQWEAATAAINAGIRAIERFLVDYDREEQAEQVEELNYLKRWRDEVEESAQKDNDAEPAVRRPLDPLEQARVKLAEAIDSERYEEAAELRDEIRRLEDPPTGV